MCVCVLCAASSTADNTIDKKKENNSRENIIYYTLNGHLGMVSLIWSGFVYIRPPPDVCWRISTCVHSELVAAACRSDAVRTLTEGREMVRRKINSMMK